MIDLSKYKEIKILAVEDSIEQRVYDIEVEEVHAFHAKNPMTGKSYASHNSAEIMLGDYNDKDYVSMKDYDKHPEEVKSHRWASNNSISAEVGKTDYSLFSDNIVLNGEPGIIWLDNARKYGRIKDGINNKDKNVAGINPSLRRGTKVATTNGIFSIETLQDKEFLVKNLDGKISQAKCFLSGKNKKLYEITLQGNHKYYCTPEHKWPIRQPDGSVSKTLTTNIKIGDYLPVIKEDKLFDGTEGTCNEGFLFGYNLGDGWITTRGDNGKTQIGFILNKEDYNSDIKIKLEEQLNLFGSKSMFNKHDKFSTEDFEVNTQNEKLNNHFIDKGFIGKKYGLPKFVFEKASEEFRKGLIDGLFSADGCISLDDYTISLTSSHEKLANDVSELLGFYGIKTQITKTIINGRTFPNGKFYDREFISYHLRIRDYSSKKHFRKLFKLSNVRKQSILNEIPEVKEKWINDFVKIVGIEYTGIEEDVWDISVYDDTHCFQLAHCITGNCSEITLESTELCVTGNTRILTKDGYPKIKDVVDKEVEVWNGDKWSKVIPFAAKKDSDILRVYLSDGSYLDATPKHNWHVKPINKRIFRKVKTKDLEIGSKIISFNIDDNFDGIYDPNAFELGMFAGDGYLDSGRPMVCICGNKIKLKELDVNGVWYKPQIKEGYTDPYNRLNLRGFINEDITKELNDKSKGLPEYIFKLNKESILEFFAGWIETDGSLSKQENTIGYRIYGGEFKLRDAQLLLRKVGINHVTIRKMYDKDQKTNFGVRNYDLYYIQIPSFECGVIPTRLKIADKIGNRYKINNAYPDGKRIDGARKQKIIKIEKVSNQDTFCFTEKENHMGVFGNVLTYQCNLVESFPSRHESFEEYKETLKYAYLYGKTMTLVQTHWPETNAIIMKNRRIGISQSGIIDAFVKHGRREMLEWSDNGYTYLKSLDEIYSNWLCIPKSIKISTVKPSGTTALLPGVSPGIHYPHSEYYIRRIRVATGSQLIEPMINSGYNVVNEVYGTEETKKNTMVVEFPVHEKNFKEKKEDISIWEQMQNAADYQNYWADNSVSITVTFKEDEKKEIPKVLETFEDRLKAISFLPLSNHGYELAPYEEITKEKFEEMNSKLKSVNFKNITSAPLGEKYCTGDACELKIGDVE